MNIPPTPEYIERIQEIVDQNDLYRSKIDVETLKIVESPNTECLGIFTGSRTARTLVRWCFDNIYPDPFRDSFRDPIRNYEQFITPGLFDEKSLERVIKVVEALWVRVSELERQNEILRFQIEK